MASPSKTGYKFVGWYKNSNLTQKYDGTTDLTTEDTMESKNIYAKYEPIQYTLKFNSAYADPLDDTKPDDVKKTYGTPKTLPNPKTYNIPIEYISSYRFDGWYLSTD